MPTAVEVGAELFNALQGRWKPLYQEIDGQMVPPSEYATTVVELSGNEFKVEKNGAVAYEGLFTIDALASPMEIVLIYRKSAQPIFLGGPRPGVFQILGDTLKWCFGAIGQPRPKGLNTYPGSEGVLSIYQRDPAKVATQARAATTSLFRGAIVW
jgi:uncharacterized protein (TIGR03067 family)